jgi:spore germination protein GerM
MRKESGMKRLALFLILTALLLTSGCVSISLTQVETAGDTVLPESTVPVPPAPVGDSRADRAQRITLYFISMDMQQLIPLSRSIRLMGDESAAEKALELLLESTGTDSLLPVAPAGTRLRALEISQGIATVDLSVDALTLNAQELIWLKAAVVNTLIGLDGIKQVNVLIDGKEESGTGLPNGTLRFVSETLTALWAQQQVDAQRFEENPAAAQILRTFTLYFGTQDQGRLLPELRELVLERDPAATLLEALRRGSDKGSRRVIPGSAMTSCAPERLTLEDGRRVIRLSFPGQIKAQLETAGIPAWQMYASLSYTLCRALPRVDGIMVCIDGNPLTRVQGPQGMLHFEGGIMIPAAFNDVVATMSTLYYADDSGMLTPVRRPMDCRSATAPRILLCSLMEAPGAGMLSVMPEGVSEADIIGIRLEDGCALVNLSGNFYRLCQGMSRQQERLLIYAMVNTLCELEAVDRVRFYVGDQTVESLAGWIYLGTELMPNPGLIRRPS